MSLKAAIGVRDRLRTFISTRAIPGVVSVELDMNSVEDSLVVSVDKSFRQGTVPDFYEGVPVRFMAAAPKRP